MIEREGESERKKRRQMLKKNPKNSSLILIWSSCWKNSLLLVAQAQQVHKFTIWPQSINSATPTSSNDLSLVWLQLKFQITGKALLSEKVCQSEEFLTDVPYKVFQVRFSQLIFQSISTPTSLYF